MRLRLNITECYPPGSKCEDLRPGVHLILLYFIRISFLTPKISVLFSLMVADFFGLNFLENNMVYTSDIGVYKHICAQISCGFSIFNKLAISQFFSESQWWVHFFKNGSYLHGSREYL